MNSIYIFVIAVLCILFVYAVWPGASDCSVLRTINLPSGQRIEIVNDACQEGLPHTSSATTIRMTTAVWNSQRRNDILRHEQVHLSQKSNPQAWSDFYRTHWDYVCSATPPPDIPRDLVGRLRPNPDTADSPWAVWRGKYVFFPIFDGGLNTLKDARIIVWNTELHREVDIPEEWRSMFCDSNSDCPNQYEHPHEISAEWITRNKNNVLLNFYAEY